MPSWLRFIDLSRVKAFVQFTIASNERAGFQNLILGSGLGGMRPNMVVLGSFIPRSSLFSPESGSFGLEPCSVGLKSSSKSGVGLGSYGHKIESHGVNPSRSPIRVSD